MQSFWNTSSRPLVGLSAMDGVTDAAMREITKSVGNPDFMVTEFTSADGIVHGVAKLLRDFYYTPAQRPIVAQIFGANPATFYTCAIICCFLGFDGIDINMGCPADSIAKKGGGASLILNPPLAKKIVKAVRHGVRDFYEGKQLESLNLPSEFMDQIKKRQKTKRAEDREYIPVSIKTRIGYDKPMTEEWTKHLLETQPDVICFHGRTLEQQYSGKAQWEEIAKAVNIAQGTNTRIFGNGDLNTPERIDENIQQSGVAGVWVGRAAMGNPWIFTQYRQYIQTGTYHEPSMKERLDTALHHAELFEELNRTIFAADPYPFLHMRKHLGWYVKGFEHATQIRSRLFQTNSPQEVASVLDSM